MMKIRSAMMKIQGLLSIALLALVLTTSAGAQTLRVGSGCTYSTIQSAVDAVATGGSATLRVRSELFEESVVIVNKSITLVGGHSDCATTAVSGVSELDADGTAAPALNLLATSGAVSLRVENFDIRNGTGVDFFLAPFPGGGLNIATTSPASTNTVIDNTWIYDNTTEYTGGGVALTGTGTGSVVIREGSLIFDNAATGDNAYGGGFYCENNYTIVKRGGRITDNTAGSDTAEDGRGGGLFIDGCTFSWFAHPAPIEPSGLAQLARNTAHGYGGGLYATGGASVFLRGIHDGAPTTSTAPLEIRGNEAVNDGASGIVGFGGAIYATGTGTEVTADRSWIVNNSARRIGGALYIADGAKVTVERPGETCHNSSRCSRLSNNRADDVGGALYVSDEDSQLTIRRTTVADNNERPFYVAEGGTLEVTDSLIHGDSNSDESFSAFAGSSASPTTTIRIRGSTIADTTPMFSIFRLVNDPARLILQDSIVHERTFTDVINIQSGSPSVDIDCVLWHAAPSGISASRTLVGDPMFTDRDQDRYYLKQGSRAINFCSGSPPAPATDLEWNPRGIVQSEPSPLHGPYDLGAFEIDDGLFGDRFED
jgi:hypothetical protein